MRKRTKRTVTIEPDFYPEADEQANCLVLVENRRGVRHEVRIKFNLTDVAWLAEGIASGAVKLLRAEQRRQQAKLNGVNERLSRVSEAAR